MTYMGLALAALLGVLFSGSPVQADSGSLDSSFGQNGRRTVDFGQEHADWSDFGFTSLLHPNGRFTLFGYTGPRGLPDRLALARLDGSGNLRQGFGEAGRVVSKITPCGSRAIAAALDPGGGIVAVAQVGGRCGPGFAVVRYRGDGTLDPNFGEGGVRIGRFGLERFQYPSDVTVQADGRILVAGSDGSGPASGSIVRYTADGRRDRSFGEGGQVRCACAVLAVLADGGVVAAGNASSGTGQRVLVVTRLRPDGLPDDSFGHDGRVIIESPPPDAYIAPSGLIAQPNGKVVVAGTYSPEGGFRSDFAIVRLAADGTRDAGFGGGDGVRRTDFAEIDLGRDIARLPDGRYVVAGTARCGIFCGEDPDTDFQDFALALYRQDGTLDKSFGDGGKVVTGWKRGSGLSMAFSVVAQTDGRIVAFGGAGSNNGDFAAARYDTGCSRSLDRRVVR